MLRCASQLLKGMKRMKVTLSARLGAGRLLPSLVGLTRRLSNHRLQEIITSHLLFCLMLFRNLFGVLHASCERVRNRGKDRRIQ